MESTKVSDGTDRTPSGVYVRDGTTTQNVHYIYVHDGVAPRLVYIRYTAMSLGDSGDVSGSCSTAVAYSCAATTSSVTVSVTNGRAPFTYAWSYVSGSGATVNSPTSATTTFTRDAAGSPGGTQYVGVYRCTVTDATGRTATNDVTVTTTHTSTVSPLSASKSGDATGSCSYATPATQCSATTGSVTVTPSGGVGPYTYVWGHVSGDTATVNSNTSATTTFTRTAQGNNGGYLYQGTYRCTVTDSLSNVASVDVAVSTTHTNTYYFMSSSKSGNASGSCSTNNGNGCTATTNTVTISVSNGAPGYTYSWSKVSGTTYTVNSPTSAATTFSLYGSGTPAGTGYSATYRCTITDSIGYQSTVDVTVSTTHYDSYTSLSVGKSGDGYGSCSYQTGNCTAYTNWVDVSVSGGLGGFSYSWSYLSGTSASISNSAGSSVYFWRTATGTQTLGGWYRCTVTDATGRSSYVDVYVQTTHTLTYTSVSASKSGNAGNAYYCTPDPPFVICPTTVNLTTNSVTVTGSGGTGSYSYSWAYLSGDTFTVNSPSAATTSFSRTNIGQNIFLVGTYRCTVSDGISAASIDVTVSLSYYNDFY
jgi:hypothetical protein